MTDASKPIVCYQRGAVIVDCTSPHREGCPVPELIAIALGSDERPGTFKVPDVSPIETLRRAIAAECECRTCGHQASAHIGGSCFECGRERCWS